jgi:FtsP/CotA-like multicopper oxidase with cupredoxin domain
MKEIFVLALAKWLLVVGAEPVPNKYLSSWEHASEHGLLEVTLSVDIVTSLDGRRHAPGYNGKSTGPTLHVKPGDTLRITLVNKLKTMTALGDRELYEYVNDADRDFVNVSES